MKLSDKRKRVFRMVACLAIVLLLPGCGADLGAGEGAATSSGETAVSSTLIDMPHLHGLGFSADGRQLLIPAHDGLRIYTDGVWSIPAVPAHDYMGFSASDDGFYSSGHPHPSTGLANPFGLVKSSDMGETLVKLGFEGESDFHLMAVGYQNHAIYVANPAPNSQLPPGVHYSLDDGKTWQQSRLQGLNAQLVQMAVHPTEAATVAVATEGGLLLSTDQANSFTVIDNSGPITAVTFTPDGQKLLFGYTQLRVYDLAAKEMTHLPTPALTADGAIVYLAVNPMSTDEVALATSKRDIYLSTDGGRTWAQIASEGKGN